MHRKFIASLFITGELWKTPRHPSRGTDYIMGRHCPAEEQKAVTNTCLLLQGVKKSNKPSLVFQEGHLVHTLLVNVQNSPGSCGCPGKGAGGLGKKENNSTLKPFSL